MTSTVNVKHRFVLRALKNASAAVLITSLLSCGGGGGNSVVADAGSTPESPASTSGTVPFTASAAAAAAAKTSTELGEFWKVYGAETSFDKDWVELLTKLLDAEDKVVLEDYQGARDIINDVMKTYPLKQDNKPGATAWDVNFNKLQLRQLKSPLPHFGEPGMYAHLRMLDEITKFGVGKTINNAKPIQMAIVMPACSNISLKTGLTVLNRRLNPGIEADSYSAVRQSLRLFQSYLWAISGGGLRLELNFYSIKSCAKIDRVNGYDYNEPIRQLPPGVADKTDMFWLISPEDLNVGNDAGGGSGIGKFEASEKPIFISEDDWIVKKRSSQGGGARTNVERRIYLPEWVQHEFFHHLFSNWREFDLEKTDHQWFDRKSWPADFIGKYEEDYYSEALNRRLYQATPSIAEKLKRATK
jgi:hypothetical protein